MNNICGQHSGVCLLTGDPLTDVVPKLVTGVIGPDMKFKEGKDVDYVNPVFNPF